jgi:tetratricopeptide (TPR) repeat protein
MLFAATSFGVGDATGATRLALIAPPKADPSLDLMAPGFQMWLSNRFAGAGLPVLSRDTLREFGNLEEHGSDEILALASGLEAGYAVIPDLTLDDGLFGVRLRLYVPGSGELISVTRASAPLAHLGPACEDVAVRLLTQIGVDAAAIPDAPPPLLDELSAAGRSLHHRDAGRLARAWREVEGKLSPTAMKLREELVEQARSSAGDPVERARVLAAAGDDRAAWDLISDRLKLESRKPTPNPAVILAAGEIHLARGNLRQARENFDAVISSDGANAEAHLGLGSVLAEGHANEAARLALRQAARLDPSDPRPLLVLADLGGEDRGEALLAAGRLAAERLDPHRARRYLEHATEAQADLDGQSWSARGELEQRIGLSTEAIGSLDRAQRAGAGDIELFRNVALAHEAIGDRPGAEKAYRDALAVSERDGAALRGLGLLLAGIGRSGEAVSVLQRALQVRPDDASVAIALARALRATGDTSSALQLLESIETAESLGERASLQQTLGDLDAAEASVARALELAPNDASLYHVLADVYAAKGDEAAAARTREMAGFLSGKSPGHDDSGGTATRTGIASFDELVLGFASQVPNARSRPVVLFGVERAGDWKAHALHWLHPRALDMKRIEADLEASLERRFDRVDAPGIPAASLLEEALGELRSFDSENSLSGDAVAIANSELGTYATFLARLRRMPTDGEEDPSCGGPENFEIEMRMVSGRYPDVAAISRIIECPAGGVGAYGEWNRRAFSIYAVALLALIFPLVRGWGSLVVSIQLPPRTKGFFSIRLSKSADKAPSKTRKKKRFGDGLRRTLRLLSRFERNLVGHETVFRWIPARPRDYTVSLMGPLMDAAGEEIIGHFLEERVVRVRRRKIARLGFDLRPNECAVEVQVLRGGAPARGSQIAVAGDRSSLRYASDGTVFIYLGLGDYRLLIGHEDRVAERALEIRSLEAAIGVSVDLEDPVGLVFSGCPTAVEPYVQSDFSSAAQALEAAGESDSAHLVRAAHFVQRGDCEGAAKEFEAAGDFERAAEYASKAASGGAGSASLFERAGDAARAADAYRADGDLVAAARCYENAYDFENALECYQEMGDSTKSMEILERTGAWIEVAQMARSLGDADRAIRNLQQISRNESSYGDACSMLAEILSERGEHEFAVEKFDESIHCAGGEHAPLELHERFAQLLEKAGEREKAVQTWGLIRKRDPSRDDIPTRISSLRQEINENASIDVATEATPRSESRYEIVEELGRGGMGVVYKARDKRLGRFVALKQLPANLRDHPEAVKLFLREAQAAASLNHRNIVTLFDAASENGTYYITMELLEGLPLNAILKKRRTLHPRDVARLGIQICAGLAYAQSQRIVHRDIKTANLFFTRDKVVKIMDFGLAKTIEEVRKNSTVIGGTPYYMAPEQAAGEAVDHRVDLYALGVTLFELATGDLPFRDGDLAYHHRHTAPPDPRELQTSLPAALAELILELLRKDPNDRVQSAAEVGGRLQQILAQLA